MSEEIMYSVITLYKDCEIIPSRNFVVDSLSDYLATLDSVVLSEFQYLRNNLELSIKIHKPQEQVEYLSTYNYNYLKVAQNGVNYYYFITKKTQVAEETILLDLVMDTINTLKWNEDFIPTDRTKVLRQHKDRFVYLSNPIQTATITRTISGSHESIETWIMRVRPNNPNIPSPDFVEITNITGLPPGTTYKVGIKEEGFWKILYVKFSFTPVPFPEDSEYSFTYKVYGMKKKVDLYSEGLNPVLYKKELGLLNNSIPFSWYLIYKTNTYATEANPEAVECFLAPEQEVIAKYTGTGVVLDQNSVESDKYYYFISDVSGRITASFSPDKIVKTNNYSSGASLQYYGFMVRRDPNDATKVQLRIYIWKVTYNPFTQIPDYTAEAVATYSGLSDIVVDSENNPFYCYKGGTTFVSDIRTIRSGYNTELTATTTQVTLKAFEEYDRTQSTLIKILCLPYLPTSYNLEESGGQTIINFGGEWDYDGGEGLMKLKDLNTKFSALIETNILDPVTEVLKPQYVTDESDRHQLDSKLYHSDYYLPKVAYDSFSFPFEIEKIGNSEYTQEFFSFEFVMTSTMRSRFLFKFPEYTPEFATEDYENVLNISRNNEAVIYNSPYLTYLRTGYNIDVKAKERSETASILGGVFDTIGAIAGTAIGIGSGNVAMAVKSTISGVSSFTSSIVNTINSIAQSEESIQRKLVTLKAQAVSVEGSDDLDLMINYAQNKPKLLVYKVSPKIEKALDDLFYYTGYVSDEIGVPSVNTRKYFNFLSCDLEITGVSVNIPQIVIEDLKNRYRNGVTFLHKVSSTWNFSQDKENWEVSVINAR